MNCPQCGHALSRADVVGSEVACSTCGARTPAAALLFPERPPTFRPEGAPPGIEVLRSVLPGRRSGGYRDAARQPAELLLRWRWFKPVVLFLILFCIVWDGVLLLWYGAASFLPGPVGFFLMCFPLLHVAAGVAITYFTLASLLNRTTIHLRDGELMVRHGPLPWRGGGRYAAEAIRGVRVRMQVQPQRRRQQRTSFELVADLDDRSVPLVKGLASRDKADYLADALRAHLELPA